MSYSIMSLFRILAFAVPIFVLARLVPLRFLENDDTVMMMLASGLYDGTPSPFLVYINYFAGVILAGLYTWAPGLHWYEGLQLAGLALAMGTLCAIALERWRDGEAPGLPVGLAILGLGVPFIAHISFTTTAAYIMAVGLWSFSTRRGAGYMGVALGLMAVAGLLRFEAAGLVVLVSLPFLLLARQQGLISWRRVGALVLVGGAMLALEVGSSRAYTALAPDYTAFNTLRGQINDNPNAPLAAEILPPEISETDFGLIMAFLADGTQITTDEIASLHTTIIDAAGALGPGHWVSVFKRVVTSPPVVLMLLVLIGFGATCRNRTVLLYVLATIVLYLAVQTYIAGVATLKMRIILSVIAGLLTCLFFLPAARGGGWPLRIGLGVPAVLMAVAFGDSALGRVSKTIAGVVPFEAQRELVTAWDGPVHVYERHIVLGNRLFSSDLAPLRGQLVLAGWLVGHPQNTGWAGHDALVQEGAALLVAPDGSSDAGVALLRDALATDYGLETGTEIVRDTPHGSLLVFQTP